MVNPKGEYFGKRLLFVGASGHFEPAIKKAQEMGAYAIVINNNPNAKGKQYADLAADVDTYVVDDIVRFAREQKVDGLFTSWNDMNLFHTQEAAEQLGLPFFATREQLDALVFKYDFKVTCRKYGVPVTPEYYVGGNLTEQDIARFQYPVIFKPIDSGGTRGMTVLHSAEGVWEAYEKALAPSASRKVVVEKYLRNGHLVVFDLAIQNDRVYLACAMDRCIVRTSESAVPLAISYMYPSKYINVIEEQVMQPITDMIHGLGIHNGIISFDGMISEGKLYLIETQFRWGGTHFYKFVEQECGVDLLAMMIDYALTGTYDRFDFEGKIDAHFKRHYACQNLQAWPGRIREVKDVDKVLAIPGVDWIVQIKNLGDVVPDDGSTAENFAKIGLSADSEKEIYHLMDAVQKTLVVLDDKGNNLIKQNVPAELLEE